MARKDDKRHRPPGAGDPAPGGRLKGECVTSVRHSGVLYNPGSYIELPRADMERLIGAGAVEQLFDISPEGGGGDDGADTGGDTGGNTGEGNTEGGGTGEGQDGSDASVQNAG